MKKFFIFTAIFLGFLCARYSVYNAQMVYRNKRKREKECSLRFSLHHFRKANGVAGKTDALPMAAFSSLLASQEMANQSILYCQASL